MPKLLFADASGRVFEHPTLLATARSGANVLFPEERPIPLPKHARLAHLPGRLPVGFDPKTRQLTLLSSYQDGRKTFIPHAVGAVLPPGYTRTLLPGEVKGDGPTLPQWAYTAAGWAGGQAVVWAVKTDRRQHWDPDDYNTKDLRGRVAKRLAASPDNSVLAQLKTCALVYRCFTSQNVFYGRDEAALPASTMCNARCVGCISEQPEDGPPASHARIDLGPTVEALTEVAVKHLKEAPGEPHDRRMVSFGQGCEGEPLTRWRVLAAAITAIRQQTSRGSININTNASLPQGLAALFDAGLDAVRVSLNSAHAPLYEAYYKPVHYGWNDVEASVALARERGGYVALNLLTFPGVTDQEREFEALLRLVQRYRVDQIQTRSLAIDPAQYLEVALPHAAGGRPLGMKRWLSVLQAKAPWLRIGNFARGRGERAPPGALPRRASRGRVGAPTLHAHRS
ncbi:MAG: radical SAM protein [Myxococcaceae bacterium]